MIDALKKITGKKYSYFIVYDFSFFVTPRIKSSPYILKENFLVLYLHAPHKKIRWLTKILTLLSPYGVSGES